ERIVLGRSADEFHGALHHVLVEPAATLCHGLKANQEIARCARLDDESVHAKVHRLFRALIVDAACKQHDRAQISAAPKSSQDVETAAFGHADVEDKHFRA